MGKLVKTQILRGPFRGAKVFLDRSASKRKIFGLYEHVLNDWLEAKIAKHTTFIDVGANNGYHTFGFAHACLRSGRRPHVIAIEPADLTELREPKEWPEYSNARIDIVNKFCSDEQSGTEVALRDILAPLNEGLVKIDIEGHERQVMRGASDLVGNLEFDWCIEIHGDELIPEIASHFCRAQRSFLIQEMRAIPFIGPEARTIHTTWLVTI